MQQGGLYKGGVLILYTSGLAFKRGSTVCENVVFLVHTV